MGPAHKRQQEKFLLSLCNTFIPGGGVREIIKSRCCARGNLKLFAARPKLPANNQTRIIQHRALLSAIKKKELLQQLRNKIALKTRRSARAQDVSWQKFWANCSQGAVPAVKFYWNP